MPDTGSVGARPDFDGGTQLSETPEQPREELIALVSRGKITDDMKAGDLLVDLTHWILAKRGARKVALEALPAPIRIIRVFNSFVLDVDSSGIAQFLEGSGIGEYAPSASRWAADLGATRTSAYLAASSALFDGGNVPKDTGERRALVKEIQSADPDPFSALDTEYSGSIIEVAECLRRWILADPDLVGSWRAEG